MRVLGIDPGLTRCGLGVVDGLGRAGRCAWSASVWSAPPADLPIAQRLRAHRRRDRGVARAAPARRRRRRAGLQPAQRHARSWAPPRPAGIALVAAARRGLPVALHTPSEVKAAVTGSGRADKAQVGAMVTRLLRLDRDAQAGRRRRRARAGDLPHLARRSAGAHRAASPPSVAARCQEPPVIAFVSGEVAARHAELGRPRGRRRRPRAALHPRHPRDAAGRGARRRCRRAWSCARSR